MTTRRKKNPRTAAKTNSKSVQPRTTAKSSPKRSSASSKKTSVEIAELVRAKVTKAGALAIAELASDAIKSVPLDWVSTQSLEIDALLRTQIPTGRIIEVLGKPHSGKTTFAGHICAEVQRRGGLAYYRDREETLDREYMRALGVDPAKLEMILPEGRAFEDDVEAIEAIITVLAPLNSLAVIVYDSVGGAATRSDLKKDFGTRQPGSAASGIRDMCRRLVARLAGTRIILLIVNHTYQTIGAYGNPERAYGGDGLGFFASIILHFRKAGKLPDDVNGTLSLVTVWKSKLAPVSGHKRTIAIARGQGFDNVFAIYTTLDAAKMVAHAHGGWCTVRLAETEELRWQGGWMGLVKKCGADALIFPRLTDAFQALQPALTALPPPMPVTVEAEGVPSDAGV